MIVSLYSIKDSKAQNFNRPYVALNDQVAIRDFRSLVNDKDKNGSLVSTYPEDFDLYCVGTFNDENGSIIPQEKFLANGSTLLEVKNGNV